MPVSLTLYVYNIFKILKITFDIKLFCNTSIISFFKLFIVTYNFHMDASLQVTKSHSN